MTRSKRERGGSTFLEFTLVGIPLIFILISTFEIARGMWIYHTLAYAVKEGTRYAIVHGEGCATEPNACTVTIAQVAARIQSAGVGLLPTSLNLTFTSNGGSIPCLLSNCLTNNTQWPPVGHNSPTKPITISATYPFQSAITMVWPGAGSVGTFPRFTFPASSQEQIQF